MTIAIRAVAQGEGDNAAGRGRWEDVDPEFCNQFFLAGCYFKTVDDQPADDTDGSHTEFGMCRNLRKPGSIDGVAKTGRAVAIGPSVPLPEESLVKRPLVSECIRTGIDLKHARVVLYQ